MVAAAILVHYVFRGYAHAGGADGPHSVSPLTPSAVRPLTRVTRRTQIGRYLYIFGGIKGETDAINKKQAATAFNNLYVYDLGELCTGMGVHLGDKSAGVPFHESKWRYPGFHLSDEVYGYRVIEEYGYGYGHGYGYCLSALTSFFISERRVFLMPNVTGEIPKPRFRHSAAVDEEGNIYVFGGVGGGDTVHRLKTCQSTTAYHTPNHIPVPISPNPIVETTRAPIPFLYIDISHSITQLAGRMFQTRSR